ncbi:MAG TPA: helix-turn-helix domain-containing protein [Dyella sp.]|uniref:helix-turn-helix domain-containing protein n=1 Tax=Dyella sp. TaxID=1869338 RepID=UPI002F92EE05
MSAESVHNTVAVVAYHQISPFHLAVPCMVFGEDLARLGAPRYELMVCAAEPGPLRTMAGFSIDAPYGLERLGDAGTIVVPAWRDPAERPPQALLDALVAAHARGARIVGLCLGAFVLAEAGLLDGRSASTHWVWMDDFAERYPHVLLKRDVLYVDDGDIITSAGTAAAIDCCLYLLRRDHGAEVANRVARRMVVAPHRHGGQAQYIEQPVPKMDHTDRLNSTLEWALANLHEPLSLDALADRAAMSRRTFTRRFKSTTGTSVTQWLLSQRLAHAQRLLETTDQTMDRIAESSGFGSTVSLRQHFAAAFATSPASYRRSFRGT